MERFSFRSIRFIEKGSSIRAVFMEHFYFDIPKKNLDRLGKHEVEGKDLIIHSSKKSADNKFNLILEKGFAGLKTIGSGRLCRYIHMNSGIPLIGSNEFGIVDRGTNMIEIKPITICNLDCVYCSVDYGKRVLDFVVEEEYLVREFDKVASIKKEQVNVHIGGQGEPTLYADLKKLVKDLKMNGKVKDISIATNAAVLTRASVDSLGKAGLSHFHISINSLDKDNSSRIAGKPYPLEKIKKLCRYISKKYSLIIAPVYLPSINDEDIKEIIRFGKKIGTPVMIQNFLGYRFGKRPVNPLPFKVFYTRLKQWEEEMDADLTHLKEPEILPDIAVERPFRKGDVLKAEIKGRSRIPHSALAVYGERVITITGCERESGSIKIRIVRDKDNIYVAVPA